MIERDPERLLQSLEGGTIRDVLRAAQADEAPAALHESILAIVTAALAPAPSEDAVTTPMSTLSGVFEKRTPPANPRTEPQRPAEPRVKPAQRAPRFAFAASVSAAPGLPRAASAFASSATVSTSSATVSTSSATVSTSSATVSTSSATVSTSSATVSTAAFASPAPLFAQLGLGSASALQLVAAVVVGVVVSKGVHFTAEAFASKPAAHSSAGLEVHAPQADPMQHRRGASGALGGASASASFRGKRASSDVDLRANSACRTECMPAGSPKSVRPTPRRAGLEPLRAEPADKLATPAPNDPDGDWLGEQLSLLSRAERSLRRGNAEDAVRALDEYQARFPRGLLDPQIGALRSRTDQHVEEFILP
jgi:hypothetical protein